MLCFLQGSLVLRETRPPSREYPTKHPTLVASLQSIPGRCSFSAHIDASPFPCPPNRWQRPGASSAHPILSSHRSAGLEQWPANDQSFISRNAEPYLRNLERAHPWRTYPRGICPLINAPPPRLPCCFSYWLRGCFEEHMRVKVGDLGY